VIGEDGLESLTIGQDGIGLAFLDFQKHLIRLQNEGTLLALASKNNEEEVWHVFDNHSSMALKREHITCARVNWQEKSDNIKEIAKELDLGLDSIVFWDDNPLEREKMRILQPSVTTLNIPEDVLEWPQYLIGLNCFSKSSFSASDYKKTDQYQARAIFQKESKNAIDMHAYLKSIKLNPSAKNLNSSSMKRALQLCQKTNQFNVRTIRHSSSDLKELSQKQEDFCFLVSLSDIYGDHGDIGLVCLSRFDRQIVFIDTFLISCRVLGRQLEIWILSEIVKRCELYDVKQIIGEFIPTDRNSPAENIFKGNGFKKIKQKNKLPENIANILSQNSSIFSLSLIDFNPSNLDLFEDV
jgi:FkbH-like protein